MLNNCYNILLCHAFPSGWQPQQGSIQAWIMIDHQKVFLACNPTGVRVLFASPTFWTARLKPQIKRGIPITGKDPVSLPVALKASGGSGGVSPALE